MTTKPHDRITYDVGDDGVLTLIVNVKDIEGCQAAAFFLRNAICEFHPIDMANKILTEARISKRGLKETKNIGLLCEVLQCEADGMKSIEQIAIYLAKKNDTLPKDEKYGPTGTTSASTMAKQIRRLRAKQAGADRDLNKFANYFFEKTRKRGG